MAFGHCVCREPSYAGRGLLPSPQEKIEKKTPFFLFYFFPIDRFRAMTAVVSMPVSSFFPDAPVRPPAARAKPVTAAPVASAPPTPAIRSAPPSAEAGRAATELRFPAARSVLWDRTPQGAPQTLRAASVRLSLAPHVLQHLCSQARGAASPHELAALLAEPDDENARERSTSGHALLQPLTFKINQPAAPAQTMQPQGCTMSVLVEPWLDGEDPSPSAEAYAELLADGAERLGGAEPLSIGSATPMHCVASASPDGHRLQLRVEALVSTMVMQAVALYALRVYPSTLSEALLQPPARRKASTGFMTMEQTRKLLLLSETDPKACDVPLVGVWVAGVRDVQDPFVWAACVRYASLKDDVAQRVSAPGGSGAFLLLMYDAPPDAARAVPKLLEVTPRQEGPPHLLLARTLELQMPCAQDTPVRCELSAASSEPLSKLVGAGSPEPPSCTPKASPAAEATLSKPVASSGAADRADPMVAATTAIPTTATYAASDAAPPPAAISAEVLAILQQLQGQVVALTARVAQQDATIAALRARPAPPPMEPPSSVSVRAELPEVKRPDYCGSSPAVAAPAATPSEVEAEMAFKLASSDPTDEEQGDPSFVLHAPDEEHIHHGPDLVDVDAVAASAVGAVEYSEDPCEPSL